MSEYGGTAGIYSTAKWLTEWPDYGDLQFDRAKLEIIGDLGEGEFGKLHLAVASGIVPKEGKTRVAVKTLKGGSSVETARDFRKELEIMMDFVHPKIIKLLGVCTKEEPLYLITELMTKGDLKEFFYLQLSTSCKIFSTSHFSFTSRIRGAYAIKHVSMLSPLLLQVHGCGQYQQKFRPRHVCRGVGDCFAFMVGYFRLPSFLI